MAAPEIIQPLPLVVITVPAAVLAELPEDDRRFATDTEQFLMVAEEDYEEPAGSRLLRELRLRRGIDA